MTAYIDYTRVPRFRLPAPLRGSTPRHFLILSLDFQYLCRSAQNDTEVDCCMGDTFLIRQSNIATNGLYLTKRPTHCVISEQTPAAFCRTPKGRRQAESRHSRKALYRKPPNAIGTIFARLIWVKRFAGVQRGLSLKAPFGASPASLQYIVKILWKGLTKAGKWYTI